MRTYRVRIAPSLLESMTLATVEASNFRGPGASRRSGVETYGYIWGHKKSYPDDVTVFHLDKLSVSITAQRAALRVVPDQKVGLLKYKLLHRLAPHKTLLADFHSHPFATPRSTKLDVGFEFSPVDFADFLDQDLFWESSDNNPVMLVQTIVRLRRAGRRGSGWQRQNVFYFDIDDHRFWINAAVGFLDQRGIRRHTGNRTRSVVIEPIPFVAHLTFNEIAR